MLRQPSKLKLSWGWSKVIPGALVMLRQPSKLKLSWGLNMYMYVHIYAYTYMHTEYQRIYTEEEQRLKYIHQS